MQMDITKYIAVTTWRWSGLPLLTYANAAVGATVAFRLRPLSCAKRPAGVKAEAEDRDDHRPWLPDNGSLRRVRTSREPLGADSVQRVVKRRENSPVSDDCGDAVASHIRQQVAVDAAEDGPNAFAIETFQQTGPLD